MTRFVCAIVLGFILSWGAAHAMFLQWWTPVPWDSPASRSATEG